MSDVQRRERSPETASGAQREPDERVREALAYADEGGYIDNRAKAKRALQTLAAALRRLQAAQREPYLWVVEQDGAVMHTRPTKEAAEKLALPGEKVFPLYTQAQRDACDCAFSRGKAHTHDDFCPAKAQRDDHPTEGLLRDLDALLKEPGHILYQQAYAMLERCRAALAASKGTPDLEHPRPRETAAESLSVDTSVAERTAKNAARYEWLRDEHDNGRDHYVTKVGDRTWQIGALDAAIDAAMSADVRSQAQDTKRQGDDQRRERGEIKPCPVHEACSDSCAARPKETR